MSGLALACLLMAPLASRVSAQGTKADNTTALNLSGSWVGGTFPTSSTQMIVDGTLTAARNAALGANLSVLGITATSGQGFTINNTSGATLTIGTSGINSSGAGLLDFRNATSLGGDITMATSATGAISFSTLTLTANQSWNLGGTSSQNRINLNGTLTTGGNTLNISGASSSWGILNLHTSNTLSSDVTIGTLGRVYVQGSSTVNLNGTNNTNSEFFMFGSGSTANVASMGNVGGASSIGKSSAIVNGGNTLAYTGNAFSSDKGFVRGNSANADSTINVTTSGQTLSMSGNLTSTGVTGGWVFGGAGNLTLTGVINNATSTTLTKQGTGTLTLSGAANNTFSGATTVSGGTLELTTGGGLAATSNVTLMTGGTLLLSGTGDRINNSATVTMAGGTIRTDGASSASETAGAVLLSSSSTMDFGAYSGGNTLSFADSSGSAWTGPLNIYNWTPGTDHLFFGSSGSGLTSAQLSQINLYSDSGSTFLGPAGINSYGEISVVPEPSSLLGALGLMALVGYRERRWFMRCPEARLLTKVR